MTTTAPASLPDQLAAADAGLPDEIAKAINALIDQAKYQSGRAGGRCNDNSIQADRAALTATILARLTAAESARDEAIRGRRRVEAELAEIEAGNCCDGYEGQIAVLQQLIKDRTAERDEARSDQKAAEDANEALEVKLRALAPHGLCACSYDKPGDVCMHHSPALSDALARAERLERRWKTSRAASTRTATLMRGSAPLSPTPSRGR